MKRRGISTGMVVAAFTVFVVILAVILIIVNETILPGVAGDIMGTLNESVSKPVDLLSNLFGLDSGSGG